MQKTDKLAEVTDNFKGTGFSNCSFSLPPDIEL